MLNNDSLSQLQALKQQIDSSKDRAEGTVKGTQGKFGFAVLDDGREIYLSPDEMLKVFPDDRIAVIVTEGSNGKPVAEIEKLISSPLKGFTGRYVVKGKAHFIEPDLPRLSRWLFVPPSMRQNAKAGDLVEGRIKRHPFKDGKPQATVVQVIGSPEQAGIEADYMIAKFALQTPDENSELSAELTPSERADHTQLPFVTIDSSSTQDMDDALYAEATENGWRLMVAIADPSAIIPADSDVEKQAAAIGTSTYLPGRTLGMLPKSLANERCSLVPDSDRPALLFTLEIASNGEISDFSIAETTIRSRAKLSYQQVADALEGGAAIEQQPLLETLQALAEQLNRYRREHNLVMADRPDYRLRLNEQGKISEIVREDKRSSHKLVEECMVAVNRTAAQFLADDSALFIAHPGFRPERLADAQALTAEICTESADNVEGYRRLIQAVEQHESELPIRAILTRWLNRSQLSQQAAPHFGMGLAAYTTVTSPIRKYHDLYLHRVIKAKLQQQPLPTLSEQAVEQLQEAQNRSRAAQQEMEQWLKCQYLEPKRGERVTGQVQQINSGGFTVRIEESGIDGYVDLRKHPQKFSFNPQQLTLTSKQGLSFQLEQTVEVMIGEIDASARSIQFTLPPEPAATDA